MNRSQKKQLFLLHFAGGNSYSFNFLKESLVSDFEFIPLELPGRGKRFNEDLMTEKSDAILDYVDQIKALRNRKPYVVYGHSMGATLGLSVTKIMEEMGDPPLRLLVSGNAGPRPTNLNDPIRHLLEDIEFKNTLIQLGGVPDEVLDNDELYCFFSPILRADFELLEKDDFSEEGIKINVPICAVMGSEEETLDMIENWSNFTSLDCSYNVLPGNHFFIHQQKNELLEIIKSSFADANVLC